MFIPYWGNDPILTNIFQMGWNHHLDKQLHAHTQRCFWNMLVGQTPCQSLAQEGKKAVEHGDNFPNLVKLTKWCQRFVHGFYLHEF